METDLDVKQKKKQLDVERMSNRKKITAQKIGTDLDVESRGCRGRDTGPCTPSSGRPR